MMLSARNSNESLSDSNMEGESLGILELEFSVRGRAVIIEHSCAPNNVKTI